MIVGFGGIIFAELKRRKSAKWQPGQKEWAQLARNAHTAGVHVVTWTFDDWPANGGGAVRELIDLVARRPRVRQSSWQGDQRSRQSALDAVASLRGEQVAGGYAAPPPQLQELATAAGPIGMAATAAEPVFPGAARQDGNLPGMDMAIALREELAELRAQRQAANPTAPPGFGVS